MKLRSVLLVTLAVVFALLLSACSKKPTVQNASAKIAAGTTYANALSKGDYAAAISQYGGSLKGLMTADTLKMTIDSMPFGKIQSVGEARAVKENNQDVIYVPCTGEKKPVEIRLTFDAGNKITDVRFQEPAPAK
ncbi:MAG: hypothetical protein ACYDBB_23000 [Armatimonadota bacterium]